MHLHVKVFVLMDVFLSFGYRLGEKLLDHMISPYLTFLGTAKLKNLTVPTFKLGGLSFSCCIVRVLYIFWIQVPYQIHDFQIFSHPMVIFTFLMLSFCQWKMSLDRI